MRSTFYDSASRNTILEPKTTLLLHLGAAMALVCIPAQLREAEQRKKEKRRIRSRNERRSQ